MRHRTRKATRAATAALGGLFVALAAWYLARDAVPAWVQAYSRPSRAAPPGDEVWRLAP